MRSYHPYRRSLLAIHASRMGFVKLKWPKTLVQLDIELPISIRCDTCRNRICEGSNLKSWREPVVGESCGGIRIFRFYFDCSKCSAKISLKDYPNVPHLVVESGATRIREEEVQEIGDPIQIDDINSIRKYKDQDSEDEEDLTRPCASYDEAGNKALKKREFSEESLDKPTDSLTKATTNLNDRAGSSVGSLDRSGTKGSCSNLQN